MPSAHAAPINVSPGTVLDSMVADGAELFINETFDGNGRTCATCHPATNNFTIDPNFIATLPDDDPLFVAENVPALYDLEIPGLMRSRGLILENVDGFENPTEKFVMRSVPHTFGLSATIDPPSILFDNTGNPGDGLSSPLQRTGWGGDGAPEGGTLREFAIGAVNQHFPKTLSRTKGKDFRFPTDYELSAMEAFQRSLGRSKDIDISSGTNKELHFIDPIAELGKEIFNTLNSMDGAVPAGKCAICHNNAGANINAEFFSAALGMEIKPGNANFATGVNELPILPADIIDADNNPRDGGFGRVAHTANNCTPAQGGFGTTVGSPAICQEAFNTPSLIEAADTPPFFHNNSVDTLEGTVAFYNSDAFNQSPAGLLLGGQEPDGVAIDLEPTEVLAVARFLRMVNVEENLRSARALGSAAEGRRRRPARTLLKVAISELGDVLDVTRAVGLHPEAMKHIEKARLRFTDALTEKAEDVRDTNISKGLRQIRRARKMMVD